MPSMWTARACLIACFSLACATPVATLVPPAPAPPAKPAKSAAPEPRPLRAYHPAALEHPAGRSAAAFTAAAEAASRAGVLDVAAYWREQAHTLEPSPAHAAALAAARDAAGLSGTTLAAARDAAGLPGPAPAIVPLDATLARAVRAASEAHAWDQVLALTTPALATAPHHDLYLWTGDALWQLGREVEARRMWSRARVLLDAARIPFWLTLDRHDAPSQIAWSRGGLAIVRERDDDTRWLEVWGDALERPWRRQQITGMPTFVWTAGGKILADAAGASLTLRDPANGAVFTLPRAHADDVMRIAGAETAPVLATAGGSGDIKIWTLADDMSPRTAQTLTAASGSRLALDAAGLRLAIFRPHAKIELLELGSGARRTLPVAPQAWLDLRFLARELLVSDRGGAVQRIDLGSGESPGRGRLGTDAGHPGCTVLAMASTGKLAGTCGEGHLVICRQPMSTCKELNAWSVQAAIFSPDGDRLAYIADRGVLVRELASDRLRGLAFASEQRLRIAGLGAGGGVLAVQGARGLAIWDTRTGAKLLRREHHDFLGFSPDEKAVALHGELAPGVEVVPLAGGEALRLETGGERARAVAHSVDGRRLAVTTGTHLNVWDLSSGTALWRAPIADGAYQVAFTARDQLVYESQVGLHVRDASGLGPTRTLIRGDPIRSFSVAPDPAPARVSVPGRGLAADRSRQRADPAAFARGLRWHLRGRRCPAVREPLRTDARRPADRKAGPGVGCIDRRRRHADPRRSRGRRHLRAPRQRHAAHARRPPARHAASTRRPGLVRDDHERRRRR